MDIPLKEKRMLLAFKDISRSYFGSGFGFILLYGCKTVRYLY